MTNRPKQIGTWTEVSIVLYLRDNGFGGAEGVTRAERITLNGTADEGDIGVCPGVMIQSKGGHMAEQASDAQIVTWLKATEWQRAQRGADVAVLVTKRKGKGRASTGQWWAHVPGRAYVELALQGLAPSAVWRPLTPLPPVRITVAELVDLLRRAGFGDPLPTRKDTQTE